MKRGSVALGVAIALGVACAAGAQTRPATRPAKPAVKLDAQQEMMLKNLRQQKANWDKMPSVGPLKWSQVLRASMDNGNLRLDWTGTVGRQGQQQRVKIEGSDVFWQVWVNQFNNGMGMVQMVNFTGQRVEEYAGDGIWSVSFNVQPGSVNISAQYGVGADLANFTYYQQPTGQVGMSCWKQKNNNGQPVFNHQGSNLADLMDRQPEVVRQYLVPALKLLGAEAALRPGPSDVYWLFESIPADPAVTRQVQELLPPLASTVYEDRAAASDKLSALGRAGVLAVRRMDLSPLTLEQRGRLSSFLALHSRRVIEDVATARRDLRLLADCLEDDDPQVRAAAKSALEGELGRAVAFDAKAGPETQEEALDQLRQTLRQEEAKRKPAATQPAEKPQAQPDANAPQMLPAIQGNGGAIQIQNVQIRVNGGEVKAVVAGDGAVQLRVEVKPAEAKPQTRPAAEKQVEK